MATLTPGGGLPRVESVSGTLVVRTDRGTWAVDPTFAPLAGPLSVVQNAAFLWDVKGGNAVVVSPSDLLALHDAGSAAAIGDEPDLIFQRFDNSGSARGRSQRVSTGAVRRSSLAGADGQYGVVFTGGQSQYFALLDAQGAKVGGDMGIGSAPTPTAATPGTTFGGFGIASQDADALSARGSGQFVRLSFDGGRVRRREILCGQ